jgi:hypothetical protein
MRKLILIAALLCLPHSAMAQERWIFNSHRCDVQLSLPGEGLGTSKAIYTRDGEDESFIGFTHHALPQLEKAVSNLKKCSPKRKARP